MIQVAALGVNGCNGNDDFDRLNVNMNEALAFTELLTVSLSQGRSLESNNASVFDSLISRSIWRGNSIQFSLITFKFVIEVVSVSI